MLAGVGVNKCGQQTMFNLNSRTPQQTPATEKCARINIPCILQVDGVGVPHWQSLKGSCQLGSKGKCQSEVPTGNVPVGSSLVFSTHLVELVLGIHFGVTTCEGSGIQAEYG